MTSWRSLAKASFGDYADWRRACEQAKLDGWKLQQVEIVLLVANPILWIVAAVLLIFSWITIHG